MNLEIHYADDWAALYVDGSLKVIGDSYLAEEAAFNLLGVKIVQDNAFMQGQNHKTGAAITLVEVEAYANKRQKKLSEAQKLRETASRLLDEAKNLEESI